MPGGRLNRIRRNFKEFNEENFIVLSALREWTLHYSPHCWEWEKMNKTFSTTDPGGATSFTGVPVIFSIGFLNILVWHHVFLFVFLNEYV